MQTQCTAEGERRPTGSENFFMFKFFLSYRKICILFHITNEKSEAQTLDNLSKDTNLQNARTCTETPVIPAWSGLLVGEMTGYL